MITANSTFTLDEYIEMIYVGFRLDWKHADKIKGLLEKTASNNLATIETLTEALRDQAVYASCLRFSYEDVLEEIAILFNGGAAKFHVRVTMKLLLDRISSIVYYNLRTYFPVEVVEPDGNMRPLRDIMRDLRAAHAKMSEQQQLAIWGSVFDNELIKYFLILLGYDATKQVAQPPVSKMSREELQAIEKKIHEATILYLETVAELVKDCGENDLLDFFPTYYDGSSSGVELTNAYMTDEAKKELTQNIRFYKSRLAEYE